MTELTVTKGGVVIDEMYEHKDPARWLPIREALREWSRQGALTETEGSTVSWESIDVVVEDGDES